MGVRLYPILKEKVTTAKFLGYDDSIQAEYDAYVKTLTSLSDSDWYAGLTEELSQIHYFQLYGWGKFYPCEWQMDGEFIKYSGSERDKSKWVDVILINGERFGIELQERVNILENRANFTDMMDGVYWV